MQKAMTIAYAVGKNLYLNITNRCPCACTFCIRTMCDGAYGSDPLWLDHEPSMEEIRAALDKEDLSHYQEVVFCGFGEPTERLETLCETAKLLKARGVKTIRINTNGLSDLIHGRKTAADLKGLVNPVNHALQTGKFRSYKSFLHRRKLFYPLLMFLSRILPGSLPLPHLKLLLKFFSS